MSLEGNPLFEKFCEQIAQESISHYLLVRWSYSTYLNFEQKRTETIIAKLDSSLLHRNNKTEENSLQAIKQRT